MKNTMVLLDRFIGFLLKYSLFIFMNGIMILVVVQIVLRYVLHMPLISIEEVLIIPVLWLYFLGTINASKKEQHISARLLEVFCSSEKQVAKLRFLASAIGIFISIWFTCLAFDLFKYSMRVQKTSMILKYPMILIVIFFLFLFVEQQSLGQISWPIGD
jgi:TRAP-type C4-dicarboxylate transport system permease small subunit